MKHIVLITSHAPSLIGFRGPLIRLLCEQGMQVSALAPNFDDGTRAALRQLGAIPVDCPIARAGMNPLRDAHDVWRLFLLLRNLRPDITLSYFIKPAIYGSIAARLAGVPRRIAMIEGLGFVFTPIGVELSLKRRALKRLVLALFKLGMACADKVVFLNPDDRDELLAAGVISSNKSYVLGGIGVDLERWIPMSSVVEPVTFMLVARLLREKGIVQYADAARIVKKTYPAARFILLGGLDDNPGALTKSDVQAWVDEGILEWYGHVPVQPWMAQVSVYVLPSFREGVPVSTQEAMAAAKAIITTDVPGCRQTVVNGVNGFLVPPRDSQALADAMCKFIEQPELIKSMGEASSARALEHFDVRKVNKRLVSVLLDRELG